MRGEYVEISALDEGGLLQHLEQLADAARHDFAGAALCRGAGPILSETDEIVGGGVVELQHLGQRLEHLK